MTVLSTSPLSGPHIADGVNRSWPFSFKVFNASHMRLKITDADGSNEVIVTSGFTIATNYLNNDAGGNVVYPIAPIAALTAGKIVRPYRDVPNTQPTKIGNQAGYFPQTHEATFDLLEMQIQETARDVDRSIKSPLGAIGGAMLAETVGAPLTLNGDLDIISGEYVGGVVATPFMAGLNASADDAGEARDLLGIDELSPAITANTMLVDNAAGTLRESKTFAQVRGALNVPSYNDLPYVDGMANGLTGNAGSNQTAALQNIINTLVPAEGGIIKYRGYIDFTTLDLYNRRNIVFQGEGGNGAGAAQRSILRCTAGAIGAGNPAIKLWKTFGIGFEKTMILQSDAAFNGSLLDFNSTTPTPGDDSALMHIRDAFINGVSASGTLLDLYGSTQGSFQNITFGGASKMVALQTAVGVLFANQLGFDRCNFKPTGTNVPIVGSGEALTFSGCNIQASSGDGKMRFLETALFQPFNGINLIGNSFYDASSGGVQTTTFYWGTGLNIRGNRFGNFTGSYNITLGAGGSGVDPQLDGVRGFVIEGNSFDGGTAHVSFAGTIANKKNPRGGRIVGNSVTNGFLLSNYAVGEAIEVGPNSIHNAPNEFGAQKSYIGMYLFANRAAAVVGGLTTGQMFQETTSGEGRLCVV